jgi:hypothetical protein
VRQREEKRVGGGRRGGFTRWRRNRPAMLADMRVSVDEFCWIEEDLHEGEKRVGGGDRGLFIASFNLQKGLGLEEIGRCRA